MIVGQMIVQQADKTIELVDGSVSFNSDMAFRDFRAAYQRCFSLVACFGIDLNAHIAKLTIWQVMVERGWDAPARYLEL